MITTALADTGSSPEPPASGSPGLVAWYAESFSDSLGDRLRLFDNAGPALELLRFHPQILATSGFESAVRLRVDALAAFRHPGFAKVRALTMLDDPAPQLALVSELVAGERLSTVLRAAESRGSRLDPMCAIWLLRHVLPALAAFHDATDGAPHRLLDADRVVVTPSGDIAITEYVFGGVSPDLLPSPQTTDVGQAALLAVGILLGRAIRSDERDRSFETLVKQACATPSGGVLRPWLMRALMPGPAQFKSAREAYHALEELLPGIWGTWPKSRMLTPAGPPPAAPALARAALPAPAVATPLALLDASVKTSAKLSRLNRGLTAVALVEAACIVALIVQGGLLTNPQADAGNNPAPPVAASMLPPNAPIPSPATSTSPVTVAMLPESTTRPASASSTAGPASVMGWLVVESPVEVKVYVNGRLMGAALKHRFGVPAGGHTITLVNDAVKFRYSVPVRISPGRSVLVAANPKEPK